MPAPFTPEETGRCEPFFIVAPAGEVSPVVFDSPHSGFDLPDDFQTVATDAQLRTTWDAYVEELWGDAPAMGATLLAARFPRAYIDANRAETDLDPELLREPWPGGLEATDYSRRGMGLIRRLALPGRPMYRERLSVAAVQERIVRYYRPYRAALRGLLAAAHARHGAVWHFDCHSMKSRGNEMNVDSGERRPDLVVSDRRGRTADPELTRWVADFFRGRGYSVRINDPYQGGDLVATFGAPAERRQSVQIEINRECYLEEAAFARGVGFGRMRADCAAFAAAAVARARAEIS